MHVCIPLNNLRYSIYHTVGLNSRKASGKHVKRSEKVLKTSSEKYLLGYTQKTSKALLVLSLLVYFYADNIKRIWNVSWNMILHLAWIGKFSNLKSTTDWFISMFFRTICDFPYIAILKISSLELFSVNINMLIFWLNTKVKIHIGSMFLYIKNTIEASIKTSRQLEIS